MKRNIFKLLIGLAASTATALADVSFNLDADRLKDSIGNDLNEGALAILVASTTDSVFSPLTTGTIATNGFLGTSDDLVIWSGTISTFKGLFEYPVLTGDTKGLKFANGWNQGDNLALLWFPTLTESSMILLNAGTQYGLYTNPSGGVYSDPWITPADGAIGHNLLLYTTDGAQLLEGVPGDIPDNAGLASLTVSPIPEPSTYAAIFGALTLGGVCYRRYRRK